MSKETIKDDKNTYKVSFDKNIFKVSVTDNDLELFYNQLDSDYTKIINTISTTLIKDKELKMLQMVIKKQERELKNFRKDNPDYIYFYRRGYFDGELKYKDRISKLIDQQIESLNYVKTEEFYQNKEYIINLLKSLLREEDKWKI